MFYPLLTVKSISFQIGYKFFYWDYYKNIKIKQNDEDQYCPSQLFIKIKQSSFKDEIREYQHLSFKNYQNTLLPKVMQYINTIKAKRTKAIPHHSGIDELKYGIKNGSPITFDHLLALCLYTDFSNLCTDFSKSFRALNNFEPLQNIKKRNRNYYFMSKYLRECVEYFGDYDSIFSSKRLSGPFYSGLSFVAIFPATDVSLCGPTSTSNQKMVAINFTGDGNGILVQFDNHNSRLHGFDCSWISQYKEESEVLFMGGAQKTRIIGVTIMETKKNYQSYFRALNKFNDMVDGVMIHWESSEIVLIECLMDYKLYNKHNVNIDQYIYDSFTLFTNNKQRIVLDLETLRRISDSVITHKLMYELRYSAVIGPFLGSSTNLFRGDIVFELFQNLQSIIIDASSYPYSYQFSFSYLLSMISKSNSLQKIKVKGVYEIWSSKQDKLVPMFSQSGFYVTEFGYEEKVNQMRGDNRHSMEESCIGRKGIVIKKNNKV